MMPWWLAGILAALILALVATIWVQGVMHVH